jgi:hypothetical protein
MRVDLRDEIEGVDDLGQIFAGDAQARGGAEADADEDGVVGLLELRDGDVPADGDAAADFNAKGFHELDLGEADLGLHLVVGDAVGVEAAGLGLFFKNCDAVAEPREFGGAAESGGAGADDGDFFPGVLGGCGEHAEAALLDVVGGEALETADLDGLLVAVVEHAGAFAEHRGRAHAGAGGAEDVGGQDGFRGAGRVAEGDFFDERRDVDAGRARHDARRVEAIEAAAGLDERLLRAQRRVDVGHVGGDGGGGKQRLEGHERKGRRAERLRG